jgi:rhodanese-related sulfurtransferase
MFSILSYLFSTGDNVRSILFEKPAVIDVRTIEEYAQGHMKGSKNIPLFDLMRRIGELPMKDAPIIVCCASGARSGAAKAQLQSLGYTQVYNGGSWKILEKTIAAHGQ